MAMVGHQTEAIYRRYAIVEETMLNEAGVKLQSFYDIPETAARSMVPLAVARAARSGKA
jgi:hypothetical protein